MLAAASAQRAATHAPQPDPDRTRYEAFIQAAREQLGAQDWQRAARAGEALSLDDAVAVQDALALLGDEA